MEPDFAAHPVPLPPCGKVGCVERGQYELSLAEQGERVTIEIYRCQAHTSEAYPALVQLFGELSIGLYSYRSKEVKRWGWFPVTIYDFTDEDDDTVPQLQGEAP